jgi:hypothetical protein
MEPEKFYAYMHAMIVARTAATGACRDDFFDRCRHMAAFEP